MGNDNNNDNVKLFPRGNIKKPRPPALALPPGFSKLEAPVGTIPPKPIQAGEGGHWTCTLDLLKELVHDIETGRLSQPELIYVAMYCRHPENPSLVSYPSYSWSAEKKDSALRNVGLLEHHKLVVAGV